MKIPYTNIEIGRVSNVDKKRPDRQAILTGIVKSQLTRTKQDIGKWRSAISLAESVEIPDRTKLITVYKDVVLDAHLSSQMEIRKNKVLGTKFYLYNPDGSINENETEKLKAGWFNRFLEFSMDSIFYGYEVIQFGTIKEDAFTSVQKIPEQYVVPEKRIVKKDLYSLDGYRYEELPWKNWIIAVGNPNNDFGLLNKATPWAIWKKNAVGAWSEYSDIFGMPVRIGKTNIQDEKKRAQMEHMLKDMGTAAYGVFDEDIILEFIETKRSDAYNVYDRLIERANSEMSKLIVGQTMSSDNGSSRSQAEVHERVANDYSYADLKFMNYVVNGQLLPFMVFHRMIPDGLMFNWDSEERLSILEQKDIIKDLAPYFTFNPDEVSKKMGFELEQKENNLNINEPTSVMNAVSNLYKDYFDGDDCC